MKLCICERYICSVQSNFLMRNYILEICFELLINFWGMMVKCWPTIIYSRSGMNKIECSKYSFWLLYRDHVWFCILHQLFLTISGKDNQYTSSSSDFHLFWLLEFALLTWGICFPSSNYSGRTFCLDLYGKKYSWFCLQ